MLRLNAVLSWVRRKLHRSGYWSLAGYAKRKVKGALDFIYGYEESVVHHVRQMGLDGVVCGHIHSAVIKDIGGVTYINCGDWVDSCTAIVEHGDGRLELVHWSSAGAEPGPDIAAQDDEPFVEVNEVVARMTLASGAASRPSPLI